MTRRGKLLLAGLFLLHALPFLTRPALIGGDEPHYALMTHSLAVDRDVELETNYLDVEAGSAAAGRKFAGRELDRHLVDYEDEMYFSHPLGLPALAAPLVAGLQAIAPGAAPDLVLALLGLVLTFLALLAGYHLLQNLGVSAAGARLLVLALYFGTPLWFYSRLFFTESYSWSLAVLSIYLLSRHRWVAASVCLGSIFLIKEANVLIILPILLGVWRYFGPRRAVELAAGPVVAFAVWLAKNLVIYGEAVVTYQPFQLGLPLEGATGLLFDPRHGLLPFAPILAVALLGPLRRLAPRSESVDQGHLDQRQGELEILALGAFFAVFTMTALWNLWWGNSCYGPRLLVPVIPALAISLAAVWRRVEASAAGRTTFILLAGLGFTIQWLAATDPFQAFWEIDIADLLTSRPLMLLLGLALGLSAAYALTAATQKGRLARPA